MGKPKKRKGLAGAPATGQPTSGKIAPVAAPSATISAPPSAAVEPPRMRKDQERALWAYHCAAAAEAIKDYENAVQTFAATVLRCGLAVAASVLERDKGKTEPARLLAHLAAKNVPGIKSATKPEEWPQRVRCIGLADYMLATREVLALATWLVRACRAVRLGQGEQ